MFGRVLKDSWQIYISDFWRLTLIAAVVYLPLDLVAAWIDPGGESFFVLPTYALAWSLAIAPLAREIENPRRQSIGSLFRWSLTLQPQLILVVLLATTGVLVGLVLLLVPGLFLMTRWTLAFPAVVFERLSIRQAFTRSNDLVKGASWSVFGLLVVASVLYLVALQGGLYGLDDLLGPLARNWLVSSAVDVTVGLLLTIMIVVVYRIRVDERDGRTHASATES